MSAFASLQCQIIAMFKLLFITRASICVVEMSKPIAFLELLFIKRISISAIKMSRLLQVFEILIITCVIICVVKIQRVSQFSHYCSQRASAFAPLKHKNHQYFDLSSKRVSAFVSIKCRLFANVGYCV